mgnify:CR=1 FL=1
MQSFFLGSRYLLKNTDSEIIESPTDLFRRVAGAIAKIDHDYLTVPVEASLSETEFFTIMKNLEFEKMAPGKLKIQKPLAFERSKIDRVIRS